MGERPVSLQADWELSSHHFPTEEELYQHAKGLSVQLVSAFIRRQELRGSDVRLDVGSLYRPDSFPRGSIDASRWQWHVGLAWPFRHPEHINILELRALISSLEWRLRSTSFTQCRALHVTDSVVALSVGVKGRSSSRSLNRLLKRYAALQVAGGIYPILGWVESEDNPVGGMARTRRIEALPSKESRAKARKKLGKLKHQVLSHATELRYRSAFKDFVKFHKLPHNFIVDSFDEFDDTVCEYVEFLWETGEPKSLANYCLAAIQHFRPQTKHRLPASWKLVKIWNQVEMPVRATPMTPEVMLAFAGVALKWGQPKFAWLLVVGYALFLRTGEMLKLAPGDIALAGPRAVVFIQGSKGSKRTFLPLERLELEEPTAILALKKLLKGHSTKKPFWDESRRSFMETWHSIAAHLKLPHGLYKPYSIRRGGATTAYKNGCPLDTLVSKGRWQHVHTARIYLDTGLQALAAISLPTASLPCIKTATRLFATVSQQGARGRARIAEKNPWVGAASGQGAAKVKTLEVPSLNDGQELQFLGRRIGLASYVDSLVPRCPTARHGACTLALDTYGSFPCSLCKQVVSAASTDAALPDPYFAYCERCWDRSSRRFVVCSKCLREHVTMCQRGPSHRLQLLDVSPYVGIPSCSRCGKKITWPWQMNVGDGESPLEPQWFHCATCGSQRDLCLACAPRYCPQRHRMECLSPLKGGFTCKSCGKGAGAGGILQLYHCCICQEAKCEVVYPNGEAALADVKLTMSMNEVKVTSVVPHGPASLAGVLPGQRVMVNDQPLVSPHALEDMMDTILVEFLSATTFDATFDSAKAVRDNLAFQLRDHRIFITEAGEAAATIRGSLMFGTFDTLLTVNGKQALELLNGEKDLTLESLTPPYLLRLRQSGPKLLCHQGCNAMCDGGHVMKAQYCGGVLCPKGHALILVDVVWTKCLPSAQLDEADQRCESCGDRYNLLCIRCGWRLSVKNMNGEDSPYKSRGEVRCKDCGRSIMDQDDEFEGHPDARRFYHCPSCWEDGIKEDRCYFCSIRHLACPKAHRMVPCLKSPFLEDLECLECHDELFPREAAYHCGDCWWNGKRSSRCESCGSLKQLKLAP
eukprot:s733_g6.t1